MTEETTTNTEAETQLESQTIETNASLVSFALKLLGFLLMLAFTAGFLLATYVYLQNKPPTDFPINKGVTIEPGTSIKQITEKLKEEGVVKSAQLLYFTLILTEEPSQIKASTYVFEEALDTFTIAKRLTEGDFDTDLVRFTHFEGERTSAIALRAAEEFPEFNAERFLANTINLEGKLFPETYFIPPTFTDEDFLELLLSTYQEKLAPLQNQFASSTLSEDEVIILASILEREANTPESMQIVSGILQNRLEIGMALQADATIEYVVETPLGELPAGQLAATLRELDSPYNTYLYPGLPPTPIGNPGLDAITAALQPAKTEYFYYVTDEAGTFYYSETYDEHLDNIELYLR